MIPHGAVKLDDFFTGITTHLVEGLVHEAIVSDDEPSVEDMAYLDEIPLGGEALIAVRRVEQQVRKGMTLGQALAGLVRDGFVPFLFPERVQDDERNT